MTGSGVDWTDPALPPPWDPPAGEEWIWDASAGRWQAEVSPTALDADSMKDPDDSGGDGGSGAGSGGGGSKGMGRAIAAGAAAAAVAAGAIGWGLSMGSSSSTGTSASNGSAAITPQNNKAVIYNKFGRGKNDGIVLKEIRTHLIEEGYQVTTYDDPTEGRVDNGTATFDNFVSMAGASVLIINTHGYDPVIPNVTNIGCGTKALNRYPGEVPNVNPSPAPPRSAEPSVPASPQVCRDPEKNDEAQVMIEWFPATKAGATARDNRVKALVRSGVNPAWLSSRGWVAPTTSERFSYDGAPVAVEPAILMTEAGIAHYFRGRQVSLIDGMFCHSIVFANAFDATNFFGYSLPSYPNQTQTDSSNLFNSLTGHDGVQFRTTTEAFSEAAHSSDFQLSSTKPVVLSPAVETVTPAEGTRVAPGTTSRGEVAFDAKMDTASPRSVISVTGCGASIEQPKWDAGGSKLSFMLRIPKSPPAGQATLTVDNAAARASPDGYANELDGNVLPQGESGLESNRDNYVWHVSCSTGSTLTIRYAGTFTDTYTHAGGSYHVNFRWDESRVVQYTYKDFLFTSTPGAATLTASGGATASADSNPDNQPLDSCSYGVASDPVINIGVSSEGDSARGGGRPLTINVVAQMPVSTGEAGNDRQLSHSGVCTNSSIDGPLPFLHQNPLGGTYDPGSFLQAAQMASADNVPVAPLMQGPFTKSFPVNYTQTDNLGGTDHVVVTATLTVSAS